HFVLQEKVMPDANIIQELLQDIITEEMLQVEPIEEVALTQEWNAE
ncbi:9747_t:CDS:1, partial [Racocetra fulgida]